MEKVMTIESSLSRIRYIGNGVTTNFSIPFPYLTNNDGSAQLAVYIGDSDTPLTEGKDYTIVGLGQAVAIDDDVEFATYEERFDGGDVVFEVAPEQGVPVAVVRNVPQTQGVVFVEGEKFPAQDFENALDKLTMEVQEIKENLQRAIVLPPTSTEKPIEIRNEIIVVSKQAKETADEAIVLVNEAKDAIVEETQAAVSTVVNETKNAVNVVTQTADKAVGDINNTAEQATSAVQSITKDAQQHATQASQSAGQAANSANSAKADADAAKIAADNAFGKINNVGDIFYTTRLDKELNGAVECNGETYNTGDFSGIQSIGELLVKGSLPYVGLEEYTNIVSANGSCRAFGWDGGAEFRVPTLNDVYIEAGNAETAGEFINESLPEIAGEFAGTGLRGMGVANGAFHDIYGYGSGVGTGSGGNGCGVKFNASYSNPVYQEGAKVKPDSVRYRAMVQLATTMTDEALVTATNTLHEARSLANEAITRLDGFDTTVDNAETEINTALEEALERIEHAGDVAVNGISVTYWE